MPPGIKRIYGTPLWDLYDHVTANPVIIESEKLWFCDNAVPGHFSNGSRLDFYLPTHYGIGEESQSYYVIDLVYDYDELDLWYGWDGATRHLAKSWRLGKWRQDVSKSVDYISPDSVGAIEQLASLEEAHCAVESEIERLARKLNQCLTAGRYSLTWAEMAALLAHFESRWNQHQQQLLDENKRSLPMFPDGGYWQPESSLAALCYASIMKTQRDSAIELQLIGGDLKPAVTLKASRDHYGWRLDVFSPLEGVNTRKDFCTWEGAIGFWGDRTSRPPQLQCPRGHKHIELMEMTAPWSLYGHFMDEWYGVFNDRFEGKPLAL